jgi:hypothetical protein
MSGIHYAVEYGQDGYASKLVWSREIQAAGEARLARSRERDAERKRKSQAPMPAMKEWADKHGVVSGGAPSVSNGTENQ